LGQKNKDTLAFNQSSCCSEYLQPIALQSFSDNVPSTRIEHRAQAYTKQTSKLRTMHQPKETSKERTKIGLIPKRAWKGKAWLTLKRWLWKMEQGLTRSQ
jgi:hypothetical protein